MAIDLEKLTEPFPESAHKWRWADKNQTRKLTYVEGHVYIRRVNEATSNTWSMEVKDITSRDFGNGQLVVARVAVTIPEHGTREGLGVQAVHERGGEDLVKGALTDALKNALKYFGVGLELYGPDYEAGDSAAPAQRRQAAPPAEPRRSDQPTPPPTEPRGAGNGSPQPMRVGPGPSSDAQHRMLRGLAKETNPDPSSMTDDRWLHGQVYARFQIVHLADLSKQHASSLINWFQARDFIDCKWPPQNGRVDPVEANQQEAMAGMPQEPSHLRDAPMWN